MGRTTFFVPRPRESVRALGTYAPDAARMAAHPELLAAADQCRGAFQPRESVSAAAMALSYLAVEGLVTHVLGPSLKGSRTSEADWTQAARMLGIAPDVIRRLLWSSQLGRHVDPAAAKANLAAQGWTALAPSECCDVAADIVLAYLGTIGRRDPDRGKRSTPGCGDDTGARRVSMSQACNASNLGTV